MKITEFALQKKTFVYVVTILLFALGAMAYQDLGRLDMPDFTIKTAVVATLYPGASPLEVEQEVTETLETAIQQLSQVDDIRSISQAGLSIIYVDIKHSHMNAEMPQIWDELRRKVNDAGPYLPPGCSRPMVNDDFGDVYGVFYAIYGDGYTYRELKDYADDLRKELLLVEDVASVAVFGDQRETIYIEIPRARAAELGLTIKQIVGTLNRQGQVTQAGKVVVGEDHIRISPSGEIDSILELKNLLIRGDGNGTGIFLKDVADIYRAYQDPPGSMMRYNGKPAIGLGIATTADGNVVTMGQAVKKRIAELSFAAPAGIELGVIALQSDTVIDSVNNFIINLIEAVAIVLLVLCLAMGLSSGLLMGVVLLLTIMGTLLGMHFMDIALQKVSLGALILALGMLVDNAIVVTEGIMVRIKMGMDRTRAAMDCISQTAWPLLGATLVAILAFAAIGSSHDTTGEMLSSLFKVMALSLGLSWVLALTLTPLLCVQFMPSPKNGSSEDPYAGPVFRFFRALLDRCLHNKALTATALIVVFTGAVFAGGLVETNFFPRLDRSQFMIHIYRPQGTHIEKTALTMQRLEKYVAGLKGVTATTSFIGQGALRFLLTYEPVMPDTGYGLLLVDVVDYRKIDGLLAKCRRRLEESFPATEYRLEKFSIGTGSARQIMARFSGPDPKVLRELAQKAEAIMAQDEMTTALITDWREKVQVIVPKVDEAVARRAGITRASVAESLAGNFSGRTIGLYRENDNLIPIVLRPPSAERADAAQVGEVQVISQATGKAHTLSDLSTGIVTRWEDPIIQRRNRMRTITVMCDPLKGNASVLLKRLMPKLEAIDLPLGYKLEWGGEYEDSNQANEMLLASFPMYLTIMFLVILAMFNRIRTTVIVFMCLPLSVIGVTCALLLTGEAFGFMCLIGFLGLTGMLIKNAVVLLEQIELDIRSGKDPYSAVLDSSVSRFRPVIMAAMTTVLGMIPLVIDPTFSGMSITIIGGLTFGTILTLIIVPVLYCVFYKVKPRQNRVADQEG